MNKESWVGYWFYLMLHIRKVHGIKVKEPVRSQMFLYFLFMQ
jgi:hypothetical protein